MEGAESQGAGRSPLWLDTTSVAPSHPPFEFGESQ